MKTDRNTYLKKYPYKKSVVQIMEVQSMKDNVSVMTIWTPGPMFNQSITVFDLIKINQSV